MPVVTRRRRAEIQHEAARIRREQQRRQQPAARIAEAIRRALPEVSALEAWRLALGWSRTEVINQIGAMYRADGLLPPGLNPSMLCRWEHGTERPGEEYARMLARAYGLSLDRLGLTRPTRPSDHTLPVRYGQWDHTRPCPWWGEGEPMTTAAGLPAVRESVHLALLADPGAGAGVIEAAEAAIEHYALNYSKHPPSVLFDEVRRVRELLADPLARDMQSRVDLHRVTGWLSALLGNLAYHLDDLTGAQVHLGVAAVMGQRVGDARLTAWAYGAQSMTARSRGDLAAAVALAQRGVDTAAGPLARAQLLGWALLPAVAQQSRTEDADTALAAANDELAADPVGWAPGRFGYDAAEHALHQADAHLVLGRADQAAATAEISAAACIVGTPGWASATLLHAQAEARAHPGDAAARALDVLERVPAARLRSTARTRLAALATAVTATSTAAVAELHERLLALPDPIDPHGRPATDT